MVLLIPKLSFLSICNGEVAGVLDIDSPKFSRFSETDRLGLEGVVRALESVISFE